MDPFCVVGASHWLDPSTDEARRLRAIEADLRRRAVRFRLDTVPQWRDHGILHLDGGSYRHLPGNLPTRHGSQFYSRLLQIDAWVLARLTNNHHVMTMACLRGSDLSVWGVPVDLILAPQLPTDLACIFPTHRIAYQMRDDYDKAAEKVIKLLFPPRSASWAMPALEQEDDPSQPAAAAAATTTINATDVFCWITYYVHGHLRWTTDKYEKFVRDMGGRAALQRYHFKRQWLPIGHMIRGVALKHSPPPAVR
jgi:hypothetical protein